MKEALFVNRNTERWRQFERLLDDRHGSNPEMLADLFVQLTDDLSYARTFYPKSATTSYLNALTAKAHQQIYRRKKEKGRRFLTFWMYEVPEEVWRSRRELLLSFIVFAVSILIGVVSSMNDDSFVRLILGDSYVNRTEANIERGDPLAIYKGESEGNMFATITWNNIKVSFFAFAFGIALSLGTMYLLFNNGLMIGAFHTLFHQHDLLFRSLLGVYIHGTLELSAIVIAGAAGLTMGNSILFPGTYSRRQSLMRGAKRGLKIVVGLVPIFIMAGFLESFVTRYYDMPIAVNLTILILSFGLIVGYFVVYPYALARKREESSVSSLGSMG